MKVYVVSESSKCWDCSGSWVQTVFSDRESAEKWVDAEDYQSDMKIEEFIVNPVKR